jgi:hypothetical protein
MEFNKISKPLDLIDREILPFVLRVGVKHEDLLAVNKVDPKIKSTNQGLSIIAQDDSA